jgi:hypothetical protein
METKKPYTAPELTIFGAVDELTKGNSTGAFTDADFPARTPIGDLTFYG